MLWRKFTSLTNALAYWLFHVYVEPVHHFIDYSATVKLSTDDSLWKSLTHGITCRNYYVSGTNSTAANTSEEISSLDFLNWRDKCIYFMNNNMIHATYDNKQKDWLGL